MCRLSAGFVVSLFLAVPGLVWAQACPAGAETGPRIASGTQVTVLGIHRDDSYAHETTYIGQTATVGSTLTNNEQTCWFGGDVTYADGTYRYYYKFAVDAGGASGVWPQCDAKALTRPIRRGERVVVLAVHPEDSFYDTRDTMLGRIATATTDLQLTNDCWYSGSLTMEDGSETYAYKVSLADDADLCPYNAMTALPLPGAELQIAAVHNDVSASERTALSVGTTLTATDQLRMTDGCWVSGPLVTSDGSTVQATRVALARTDGTRTTCAGDATPAEAGARMRVSGVHAADPYGAVANDILGTSGTVLAVRPGVDGCWSETDFEGDNGVRYRFSRATFSPLTPE